jgi:hypothetical protein
MWRKWEERANAQGGKMWGALEWQALKYKKKKTVSR